MNDDMVQTKSQTEIAVTTDGVKVSTDGSIPMLIIGVVACVYIYGKYIHRPVMDKIRKKK